MRTERLRLAEFTAADADVLAALHGDPAVMRFIDDGRPRTRAEVEHTTLPGYLAEYRDTPGLGHWALRTHAGGFVGWVCLTATAPDVGELGYRLAKPFWGNGFATEAARAVVDHGFAVLTLRRIVATTMTVNTGSRRVLANCGLRHLRTAYGRYPDPIPGAEHGDVDYALDRARWRAVRTHRADAEVTGRIGRALRADPTAPARLPRALADAAVAAWHRDDDTDPGGETAEQATLRGHAATLALIGCAVAERGTRTGDGDVLVTLAPELVADALAADRDPVRRR